MYVERKLVGKKSGLWKLWAGSTRSYFHCPERLAKPGPNPAEVQRKSPTGSSKGLTQAGFLHVGFLISEVGRKAFFLGMGA